MPAHTCVHAMERSPCAMPHVSTRVPLDGPFQRQLSDGRIVGFSSQDMTSASISPTRPPLMSTNSITYLAREMQEKEEKAMQEAEEARLKLQAT